MSVLLTWETCSCRDLENHFFTKVPYSKIILYIIKITLACAIKRLIAPEFTIFYTKYWLHVLLNYVKNTCTFHPICKRTLYFILSHLKLFTILNHMLVWSLFSYIVCLCVSLFCLPNWRKVKTKLRTKTNNCGSGLKTFFERFDMCI